MALTLVEKLDVSGMGNRRMVVYEITGDGETRTIQANQMKMQRIEFAYSVNVSNPNFTPIVDYEAGPTDTIAFDDEIVSGYKQLVICYGY
jgi:hypothetical protein